MVIKREFKGDMRSLDSYGSDGSVQGVTNNKPLTRAAPAPKVRCTSTEHELG